jgi:CRISPR-associated protein Csc3
MAEWASLVETQFEERLPGDVNNYIDFVFSAWNLTDLRPQFEELRPYQQRGTGIRHRWYWTAAHALYRTDKKQPDEILLWLKSLSQELAELLPQDLPESSKANQGTWDDLTDYIKTVLTLKDAKSTTTLVKDELANYAQAKKRRGKPICAICGSNYSIRVQLTSAVAFQPGVYTQRLSAGASENKRSICSICATEQLLRQLFMENLDTGSDAESQRIRYLSFYPSYFFSPETLRIVERAYNAIKTVRLSDSSLWRILREQDDLRDVKFWQRLEAFLLRPEGEADDAKFKRVLRYSNNAQATFFTVGFRNIDPSETESWILPALLAFVMSICLDVKVVASDSGVPLMLESAELPETLWFDGAHAAVQGIIQQGRLHIDSVGMALARLTVAYLIHLDTEYAPPKENWQRFVPIANALCESPLYVFHYLKKQERDDRPLTQEKARRYIRYAELFTEKGDKEMSHAKELVRLYRGFYRAKSIKNANSILRPLSVVSDALLAADHRLFNEIDSLIEVAYGELYRFMDRVSKGLADGRFPKGISVEERQKAMREFSAYFVTEIFQGVFNKDVAALRGKQLNLLKSACEVLYRDAQAQEWAERGRDADDTGDETDES